jgi:hypothetical protein
MQIFEYFLKKIIKNKYDTILFIILWVLIFYKIAFFAHPIVPYGYDPGLYREIHFVWTNIINSGFDRSQWPRRLEHEPLWWFFSATIWKLGISIDIQLTIVRSIVSCIPWCILSCYITKRTNLTRWLIWWIFYFLSVIQREATVMMYYKQLITLSLWLLLLLIYESKYTILTGLLVFLMIGFHRHTSLFFILILWIDILYKSVSSKKYNIREIVILGISIICWLLFYLPQFHKLIINYTHQFISTTWWNWHQWMFFTRYEFLQYDFMMILWWLAYIIHTIIKKDAKNTVFRGIVIWYIWLALWLLNANRQQILLDPFLIIGTILFVYHLYIWHKKKILLSLSILFFIQWSFWLWYISETKQLLSRQLFSDIQQISSITQDNDIIIIDDSQYTTWIMGYGMRDRISPWLSDYNKWNYEQWKVWRNANEIKKCELLKEYEELWRTMRYRSPRRMKEQDDCFSIPIRLSKSYLYNIIKSPKR